MVRSISSLDIVLEAYKETESVSYKQLQEWESRLNDPHELLQLYHQIVFDSVLSDAPKELEKGLLGYLKGKARETVHVAEKRTTNDALTGIANSLGFQRGIERCLARAERERYQGSGRSVALIFLDVNNFKTEANDKYGHPFGDDVLKYVGQALDQEVRRTDLKARLMGDEFVLVLDPFDMENSTEILESLAMRVNNYVKQGISLDHPDKASFLSVSLGMSILGVDAMTKEELLDHSDKAMYYAKRNPVDTEWGKLHFHVYNPAIEYIPKEGR